MKLTSIFSTDIVQSPLLTDFNIHTGIKHEIIDFENFFSDINKIVKLSIRNGTQPSPIPIIIDYLLKHKETNEFKTKIRQLYEDYFNLIFDFLLINEVSCAKQLLLSSIDSSDFGIKVSSKFYYDLIIAHEKNLDLNKPIIDLLKKNNSGEIASSYIKNIFSRIPNRMIEAMSPDTRLLFINEILKNRPRLDDLNFIKNYYKYICPNYAQRLFLLISKNTIESKIGFFISISPKFILKLISFYKLIRFILKFPYILKAIPFWIVWLGNIFFTSIRIFHFLKLRASDDDICICRAMGGIGDLVMLRVAVKLHLQLFKNNITLYIPENYHSIFLDIPRLKLLVSDDYSLNVKFIKTFNFTNCPAGHIEGSQYPSISINRIEAFIIALNLFVPSHIKQYKLLSFNPEFYPISNINCINKDHVVVNLYDLKVQSKKKILFFQPFSADSYKNLYCDELLSDLDSIFIVILIVNTRDFYIDSKLKNTYLLNEKLNGFISAVQLSDICVGVDSSLIHIARGFMKPIVGIFGPTDGDLLMQGYPYFKVVQNDQKYFCNPCWRNESVKCRWNNSFKSDCMSFNSKNIKNAIFDLINQAGV